MPLILGVYQCIILTTFVFIITPKTIDIPECLPPNFPLNGGYGPREDFYEVGSVIHYYCDQKYYLSGNYSRTCEDYGGWSGEVPYCDTTESMTAIQSPEDTEDPVEENGGELAIDGRIDTCSLMKLGKDRVWKAFFNINEIKHPIRVMLFFPMGKRQGYEVRIRVWGNKNNITSYSCGSKDIWIDTLEWIIHDCPAPDDDWAVGVQITSTTTVYALSICELVLIGRSPPYCSEPDLRIENGRLMLTRKTATLVCNRGFSRSPDRRIECLRNGIWDRKKSLYCMDKQWETGGVRQPFMDEDP